MSPRFEVVFRSLHRCDVKVLSFQKDAFSLKTARVVLVVLEELSLLNSHAVESGVNHSQLVVAGELHRAAALKKLIILGYLQAFKEEVEINRLGNFL